MPRTFASAGALVGFLKETRKAQNVSQKLAAEALGVKPSTLCRVEKGLLKKLPPDFLGRYAAMLGLKLTISYEVRNGQ